MTRATWQNAGSASYTEKAIRRGVFKSVPDLIAAIEAYLQANQH